MKATSFLPLALVSVVAMQPFGAPADVHAQAPTVKIPQAGVPQVMTLEGTYVRVAYNNEGYAIIGYRLANMSVGEEWMLLEFGTTLREGVPDYKLTRDALSLETPDGKTIPMATNHEYRGRTSPRCRCGRRSSATRSTTFRPPRTGRAESGTLPRWTSARCRTTKSSSAPSAHVSVGCTSRCQAGSRTGSIGST